MICLACLTLMNQLMFKHSSRSRPLKLSAKAFSTGLPGLSPSAMWQVLVTYAIEPLAHHTVH